MSPIQVVSSRNAAAPDSPTLRPEDEELLRALLAEARGGARVALLGRASVLAPRLEQAGCAVLRCAPRALAPDLEEEPADSAARQAALSAFRADLVVLTDEWVAVEEPQRLLRELVEAAPQAELVLPFYNAASSSGLLAALTGARELRGETEEQVERWLAASGLKLRQRQLLQPARLEGFLAQDAERALHHLFQQLNPRSTAHRLLYWSRCANLGETLGPRELVPGLLSVVMRNHSLERLKFLDHAIFALACQDYQPLEIVIASQCRDPQVVEALTQLLEKYRPLGGFTYQVLHEPADTDIRARLANKGVEAARGQYVAFLDDDDVMYPQHYQQLIEALQAGKEAWAVGRIRRAFFVSGPRGELYCRHKDEMGRGESFDLTRLIHENYITCHSYVLDRSRLGRFPVSFAEELSLHEDYSFLLRLSALFRPIFAPGVPSCEYRIRDDGTNSILHGGTSPENLREKQRNWELSSLMKDASKRKLQMLVTEQQFQDETERIYKRGLQEAADAARQQQHNAPRFLFIDKANSLLKQRHPQTHQKLKNILLRLL